MVIGAICVLLLLHGSVIRSQGPESAGWIPRTLTPIVAGNTRVCVQSSDAYHDDMALLGKRKVRAHKDALSSWAGVSFLVSLRWDFSSVERVVQG